MRYENGIMKDIKISYIGGGSRGWAWTLMNDLGRESVLSGSVYLYDLDKEAAKINETIGNKLSAQDNVKSVWKYVAADTLKEALEDSDFVVVSITPKTLDEMEIDVHAPEQYGIYQSVGDTTGPGGFVRAMRTIPMFNEIALGIKEWCPNAWVLNFTNPMAICVKALYEAFPEIKAFGCCHEVFGTQKLLATILDEKLGIKDVPREDITVNVFGVNHFTWFNEASYQGMDLFPLYKEFVDEHYEEGFALDDNNWANEGWECSHRVKFDLFREYGYIAAAGDRHLAEFMPGDKYLKSPEVVKSWKFGLTKVSTRKSRLASRNARGQRLFNGEEQIQLKPTGEEGVLLIKALCGMYRFISNVNIPNTALQIPNLPADAIVECNAVFERDSVKPIYTGFIPENVKELLVPHIENQKRVVDAANHVDKELLAEAFATDPLVKGRMTKEEIQTLVEEMLVKTL
jgi:alpha-galactosidase